MNYYREDWNNYKRNKIKVDGQSNHSYLNIMNPS